MNHPNAPLFAYALNTILLGLIYNNNRKLINKMKSDNRSNMEKYFEDVNPKKYKIFSLPANKSAIN